MKKILIFLFMVAALATVSHAVVIDSFVNADFDSGAVSNPFKGFDAPDAPEIIGWTNYRNAAAGPLNDAGVEGPGAWWGTYENNSAFMSPDDAAYNISSYVIQAGDVFNVSFVGKFWNWGGTGQWTVSLFYDDPANVFGSFTAAPGDWTWIPLSNATPIVATPASVGGTLGILFKNTGTAISNLDELIIETVPLEYNSPADGATMISAVRTNAENDLVFTVNDPNITKVDVLFGTENDPNLTTKPEYKIVDDLAVTLGQYTVNLESLAADLLYGTTYYWKVIGYEPNAIGLNDIAIPGPVWSFTTIPATPVFTVNPGKTGALENGSVSLTATATSLTTLTLSPTNAIKWYKVGTPNVEITTGITETRNPENTQATSIMEISSLTPTEEGEYFATASNAGGTGTSTNGTIMLKKLLAQYLFDDNLNDNSGNGLTGTNQTPSGTVLTPSYLTSFSPAMGKTLDFNGLSTSDPANTTGNYVDLPDGFSDFSLGITIAAWVNPSAVQNWARIAEFGNGTNGASNSFYFTRVASDSSLRFENDNLGGAASSITTGNNVIALNEWQLFVIAINNNATDNAVIYKNGAAVTTGTITLPNVITRTNCFIGKSEWYGDSLYKGQMDDVRIYNYGLSIAEVAQMYTEGTPEDDFVCETALAYDINGDCRVNLDDLIELAGNWLGCERVPAESCSW